MKILEMLRMRRKGQLDLLTLIGFFVVFLVFILGLYPAMKTTIDNNINSFDPLTQSIVVFVPLFFFGGLFIGILYYAFGRRGRQESPQYQ